MAISKSVTVEHKVTTSTAATYHHWIKIYSDVSDEDAKDIVVVELGSWADLAAFQANPYVPLSAKEYVIPKTALDNGGSEINKIYSWIIANDPDFTGGTIV